MGLSFKIARTGTKYCPKPRPIVTSDTDTDTDALAPSSKRKRHDSNTDFVASSVSAKTAKDFPLPEQEASFALNLFPDGFSMGKPTEVGKLPPPSKDLTGSVHPYDRKTTSIFQAINSGLLPGDIFEDIPCKYVDGGVYCEIRDYREGMSTARDSDFLKESIPVVHSMFLRPTTENIVKDISSLAEESWTYSNLMEIESQVLKAVQPNLCLDAMPKLQRLFEDGSEIKLNLAIPTTRCQRLQPAALPSINMSSKLMANGKKSMSDKVIGKEKSFSENKSTVSACDESISGSVQELSSSSPVVSCSTPYFSSKTHCNFQPGQELSKFMSNQLPVQSGISWPRHIQTQGNQSPISSPTGALNMTSSTIQDWNNSLMETKNSNSINVAKRDVLPAVTRQDVKRTKQDSNCLDRLQQQNPSMQSKDAYRVDRSMLTDIKKEAVIYGDRSLQKNPQQLAVNIDQQAALREALHSESKQSIHLGQRSGAELKIKEEFIDPAKCQVPSAVEIQESERNNEDQLSTMPSNERLDHQHLLSPKTSQHGKMPFQWHGIGSKDQKRDEILSRSLQNPRDQQGDTRNSLQSPPLVMTGEVTQSMTSSVVIPASSPSSFYANSNANGQERERSLGPASGPSAVSMLNANQNDLQHQQLQGSMPVIRQRSNSIPKSATNGVASPGSVTNPLIQSNGNGSTRTTSMSSLVTSKADPSKADASKQDPQAKQHEVISKLVSVSNKHNLFPRRKKADEFVDVKRQIPSIELLMTAFENEKCSNDQIDANTKGFMANSHVGRGANGSKTRTISFERNERLLQGYNKFEVILKMIERANDTVEAVVQFNHDIEDIHVEVLPPLSNISIADRFASQFCTLMVKDGYELNGDQISSSQAPRLNLVPNAASITMTSGACTMPGSVNQSQSQRVSASQNVAGSVNAGGISPMNSMQFSNANALAAARMPPPGSTASRHVSSGFMQNGLGTSSKPLQLDASQLVMVQQHHQQQHPQLLRSQQIVSANSLGQMTSANHHSNQQMNPNHAQHIQMLQQRQQQQQQQQLQRKYLGSLGGINAVNGMNGVGMAGSGGPQGLPNIVGMNGMSNVMGMGMGMGSLNGISSSMSGLGNIGMGNMGQNSGIGNMIGHNLRSGTMNSQAAVLANKNARLIQGRGRTNAISGSSMRSTLDNVPGVSVSNQAHSSVSLAMLGQSQIRSSIPTIPRAGITGMGPPKLATSNIGTLPGQNFYPNQQLSNQSQQINSHQQLNLTQTSTSQQALTSQSPMNIPHQLGQQQQANQAQHLNLQPQINLQQQSSQSQMNQQLSSQSPLNNQQLSSQQINAGNLGSLVAGPSSPQHSSQTLGSVGSITSSPMELQSGNRGNSLTKGP